MTNTSDSVHISPPRVMHVIAYASARVPAIRVALRVQKAHGRSHRARERCVYAMSMGAWGVRVCIQPGRAAFSPLRASVRGRAALRHPRRAGVRPCGIRVARSAEPVSCRASPLPRIVEDASPHACHRLGISGCAGFVAVARSVGAWDIVFSTYTPNEMGSARHEHQSLRTARR